MVRSSALRDGRKTSFVALPNRDNEDLLVLAGSDWVEEVASGGGPSGCSSLDDDIVGCKDYTYGKQLYL